MSERQRSVLRAVATTYVGTGAPVGSRTVSHLLSVKLSSASIRTTMAELTELQLLEQPHASAGRVPTERGLRVFVDRLLEPGELAVYDRRSLAFSFEESAVEAAAQVASRLLTEHTGQLGFVVAPRLEWVKLRHVSLVRLSSERVLVVLVTQHGRVHRRVIEEAGSGDQAELERIAAALNERVMGRTLTEIREGLARELGALRDQADRLVRRALALGLRALETPEEDAADLIIATHLALLDQPEFNNPDRIRELLAAVETREHLLEVLDKVLGDQLSVAFGAELEEPALRHCAVVVAPYGQEIPARGALGVIGPSRMDYARIIPLVNYCSRLITEKLS
ncbi:MAG: heat-inducible transcriptional repressor HrcA [Myxococcota bacterium]